jgi:hypothetical protein
MLRLLSLVLLLTSLSVGAEGQAASNSSARNDRFFPLEEVRPGMRAVGYTVFEGSEPKAFEVEILGVLKGFPNPQQSAIIAKLLGPELEHTGVFGGMSGSPVYINGRLLGAIAFGYLFAKDPIAGITPIQQMIELFEQRPAKDGNSSDQPRPVSFSEIAFNEHSPEFVAFVNGPAKAGAQTVAAPAGQVLRPIAAPIAITGVPPSVIARFAPQFQEWGLLPVAGAASAAGMDGLKKADEHTLKPGSTIVVPLVRGDFSLAISGTVTYRDQNRVYAFGHPLLSLGVSDLPMNEGEVVTVMSSSANSFKLTVPAAMVGAVRGDRSSGIYGELGVEPHLIPVEINLHTSRGGKHSYRFEVVSDRFLTPILLQMTTLATISSTERLVGDSTLHLLGRIAVKGQPEIQLENRLSTSVNAPLAAAFSFSQPINVLLNSGFSDLVIERISLEIVSKDARNTGKLDRLWINRTEVKRGEKIEVQAFARTESGGEYVERIPIEVPADAPLGPLQIIVGDGPSIQATEPRTGFTPKSLGQLVRELNRIRKSDRLYVKLARAETGAVINNEELPNLPPSVLATLGSDRTAGGYVLTNSTTLFEKELPPAEFVISGQRTLTVKVIAE